MQILPVQNYDELSETAAQIVLDTVSAKPDCLLGLATGSTPVGTYQRLVDAYRRGKIRFARCQSVNLDEYAGLTPTHEASYRFFMQDNLFNHIDIPVHQTHLLDGTNADPAAECARYNARLTELGAADIQILGLGHNGHIAFNEPAEHFTPRTHMAELDAQTIDANRRFFANRADVPRRAYTMGMADILSARRILLLVSGAAKSEVLAQSLNGPITPKVPASILQLHQNLTVIADTAAMQAFRQ